MKFDHLITVALKHYIDRLYDNNIKVIPTLFKCVSNSAALYDVEIIGNVVNNTYNHLQDVQIVELGIATLTICNHSCEVLSTNVFDQQQEVNNDESSNSSVVIGSSVSLSVTVIILICIIVVAVLFCVKHR